MDRNTEYEDAGIPYVSFNRSRHSDIYTHQSTFNLGQLKPFFFDQLVQPGDTYTVNTSFVIRLMTPKVPIMGNLYADIYFFSAPWWVLWEHAKEFWGENKLGAWTQTIEYTIPKIIVPNSGTGVDCHHFLSHIGFRPYTKNIFGYAGLALRMYFETWNYWFRDQTVTPPINYSHGDADITYDGTTATGGTLLKVCRFHDYMSSLLPEPQKGSAETISLGTSAPVYTGDFSHDSPGTTSLRFQKANGTNFGGLNNAYDIQVNTGGSDLKHVSLQGDLVSGTAFTNPTGLVPSNLYTDLTQAISATINAMRIDVAMQHIKEHMAIFGTRYDELTRGLWGTSSTADLLQIAEYLGGKRVPLNIETVLQTSASESTGTPQGWTGAYSVTADADHSFTKSFTAHSVIIGLICIRQDHTYAQGMPAQFLKSRKYDFYWNDLAGVGYQPVTKKEIFTTGTSTDNQVFAYKQPWQEYRQWNNMTTGELSPDYATSLDYWTLADDYSSAPVYSTQFLEETPDYLDRTLTVPSTSQDQFIMDLAMDITKISEVPQYGIPGLSRF